MVCYKIDLVEGVLLDSNSADVCVSVETPT